MILWQTNRELMGYGSELCRQVLIICSTRSLFLLLEPLISSPNEYFALLKPGITMVPEQKEYYAFVICWLAINIISPLWVKILVSSHERIYHILVGLQPKNSTFLIKEIISIHVNHQVFVGF
jgi:hypothetical protein